MNNTFNCSCLRKGKTATDILVHNTSATRPPNMLGANVIVPWLKRCSASSEEFYKRLLRSKRVNLCTEVVCDVLNALGAGFSLKFIDLFLKADVTVKPHSVLFLPTPALAA